MNNLLAYGAASAVGTLAGAASYYVATKTCGDTLYNLFKDKSTSVEGYANKIFLLIQKGTSRTCSADELKQLIGENDFEYTNDHVTIKDGTLEQESETTRFEMEGFSMSLTPAIHERILNNALSDNTKASVLAASVITLFSTIAAAAARTTVKNMLTKA
jgi:hypothetical protein